MTADRTRGLSQAEAARRLAIDGPNALPGGGRRSLLHIAAELLREPMFLLLLAAGTLYLMFGDLHEGLTLFGFVVITLGLTLVQQGRTERAIEALRDLTSPRALVIRDGQAQRIAGRDVVRGDVLKLSEGDRVPADALLITADGVGADESLLTGESVPVGKRAAHNTERASLAAHDDDAARTDTAARDDKAGEHRAPGGDDRPMVYAGTLIVQGHALAVVTATGVRSEIGRIGQALGRPDSELTPLQRQTAILVRNLALLALILSLALVVIQGVLTGRWLEATLAGIALAMAMLPEEYPVVLTIFPALGARRLSREGVLTRRINAIETLGATSVLCTDKTGTLTANHMTVTHLCAGGPALNETIDLTSEASTELPEVFHPLVEMAILASVVDPFDPMEKAFHELGQRFLAGTEHLHANWQLEKTYALTPELRAMSHAWRVDTMGGPKMVAAKGAPEAIMDLCHLDHAQRRHIALTVDQLAAAGLRVLAVAHCTHTGSDLPAEEHAFDFSFVGLLGLSDPVRPDVPSAIAECQAAGIRVVMITGDYPTTARAIAARAGLDSDPSGIISGEEIATLSDDALRARMASVTICARISPEQKLRIVAALRARGEIVAMTGDGVNDAPALRAAHVGVAMGGRGTDVARESASLVLVDDSFSALVRAVKLGRRIFSNLRKAMSYGLAVHVPIAGMALLPVLLGWPALLYPMHIALLEMIIDPACSLAFENEAAERDVMRRPPRDTGAPLFDAATLGVALLQGAGVLAVVMLAFSWNIERIPESQARAFAFATLVAGNLALILSNRSASDAFWSTLLVPNHTLWAIIAAALALLCGALYLPWAMEVLRFAPLPAQELLLALTLGISCLLWFEAVKWVAARRLRETLQRDVGST